ncbi:Calx-beta domain-containing protein [Aerosakkonemataceae cyanobacterium BLCC-F50]|uniref:Calx-beta domain-containing protein n=1 Tax=Floridaenema flaviceps BLCC-F50 TaxID=3153642 RepID=A0ABV4XJT0_9CYAN
MDQINFTRETFEVAENGTTTFPVTLIRSGNGIGTVTVQIKLASSTKTGRATVGKDYKNATVTVTWADGETGEKIVDIGIIDDGIAEPIERVNLSFGEIIGAIKGAIATCVVAIQDSTNVTTDPINPEPNKIINVCSQSDYVKRTHQDGLCFNLEFTKPGIDLKQMHFDYDLDVTLWKCVIPQNFGDVHSVSIAFPRGILGANPGLELVGLAFSYDNVSEFYKALEIQGFIPKLKPENNNLYARPGYVESIRLYPFAEISIDGVDVTRRYVVDEKLDESIRLSDLKNFLGRGQFNAVSIQQGQEFVLILDQPLKTDDRPLYLYVSEGGVAGETFSVYLNPVPKGFTFPPIKPGTTPKYWLNR